MDFTNELFVLGISMAVISVVAGYILFKNPPKNINFIYGYRTKTSMKSKERWDFAQIFSAKLMIKGGILFFVLGILGPLLNLPEGINITIGIGSLLLFCVFLIYLTEKKLKQKFKNDDQNL